ncbi:hypothetical protein GIB67_034370 [Kingdonia uniflora]|uniref:KIB1-4 beta-propeller domain-containing protein n=1 Tax=Kingdonia uniflora TaxID=39325 RepID=A0A7J7NSS9_9MAGN|nr:hypothetical protein GIB67_034370 [Kingdonia uniflora]
MIDNLDRLPIDRCHYIHRVVLSANATPSDFYAIAIYGKSKLAFCMATDEAWSSIEMNTTISNCLCCEGMLYVVDHMGNLYSIDVTRRSKKPKITLLLHSPTGPTGTMYYLVDTSTSLSKKGSRELLMREQDKKEWVVVGNLNDRMLFVGDNNPILLSALDFPVGRRNCIYFTDDYIDGYMMEPWGARDLGIFSLEDGTIEAFYPKDSGPIIPPPIWIQPTWFPSILKGSVEEHIKQGLQAVSEGGVALIDQSSIPSNVSAPIRNESISDTSQDREV